MSFQEAVLGGVPARFSQPSAWRLTARSSAPLNNIAQELRACVADALRGGGESIFAFADIRWLRSLRPEAHASRSAAPEGDARSKVGKS
jgi:hypothetical protein